MDWLNFLSLGFSLLLISIINLINSKNLDKANKIMAKITIIYSILIIIISLFRFDKLTGTLVFIPTVCACFWIASLFFIINKNFNTNVKAVLVRIDKSLSNNNYFSPVFKFSYENIEYEKLAEDGFSKSKANELFIIGDEYDILINPKKIPACRFQKITPVIPVISAICGIAVFIYYIFLMRK